MTVNHVSEDKVERINDCRSSVGSQPVQFVCFRYPGGRVGIRATSPDSMNTKIRTP